MKKQIEFKNLLIEEQRMLVLKDTLILLQLKKLRATPGVVVVLPDELLEGTRKKGQLQPVLKAWFRKRKKSVEKPCEVCERGALLCALVTRDNDFKIENVEGTGVAIDVNKTNTRLSDVFTVGQLALMETAFEGRYNQFHRIDGEWGEAWRKSVNFYHTTNNLVPQKRAINIIKNALKHKGIFTP